MKRRFGMQVLAVLMFLVILVQANMPVGYALKAESTAETEDIVSGVVADEVRDVESIEDKQSCICHS